MALIRCHDCGKKISDTAPSCPRCGWQVTIDANSEESKAVLIDELSQAEPEEIQEVEEKIIGSMSYTEKKKKRNMRVLASVILCLVGIILFIFPIATREEIVKSVMYNWFSTALEDGSLNEQVGEYLGYVPNDEERMEIVNLFSYNRDFYEWKSEQLSDRVLMRQLPYFIVGALCLVIGTAVFVNSRKYTLVVKD